VNSVACMRMAAARLATRSPFLLWHPSRASSFFVISNVTADEACGLSSLAQAAGRRVALTTLWWREMTTSGSAMCEEGERRGWRSIPAAL